MFIVVNFPPSFLIPDNYIITSKGIIIYSFLGSLRIVAPHNYSKAVNNGVAILFMSMQMFGKYSNYQLNFSGVTSSILQSHFVFFTPFQCQDDFIVI